MPSEQAEEWESLKEMAEDTFANEEGLDAKVLALLNEGERIWGTKWAGDGRVCIYLYIYMRRGSTRWCWRC